MEVDIIKNYNPVIRESYCDYLQSLSWEYFATITFKYERHDTLAAIRDVGDSLVRPGSCHRAFLACEPHKSGALHLHGLLLPDYESNWRPEPTPENLQDRMDFEFGRSRIQFARDDYSVSNYCAKYVLKNNNIYEYAFIGEKKYW